MNTAKMPMCIGGVELNVLTGVLAPKTCKSRVTKPDLSYCEECARRLLETHDTEHVSFPKTSDKEEVARFQARKALTGSCTVCLREVGINPRTGKFYPVCYICNMCCRKCGSFLLRKDRECLTCIKDEEKRLLILRMNLNSTKEWPSL